jgi:O-antigen chain-terminating methyltransferase
MTADQPIDHATLRREIRAEADTLPPFAATPAAAPAANEALPHDHPQRLSYALGEFVNVHNEAFVEMAYRCLLKRAPDPNGMLELMERLADGDSKVAILGDLRYSREGRGFGVHVAGLAWRYRFWRATRWPLVGGIIERLALVAELPQIAREQRRLGQALARHGDAANGEDLVAEVRALRDEVAALRAARKERNDT